MLRLRTELGDKLPSWPSLVCFIDMTWSMTLLSMIPMPIDELDLEQLDKFLDVFFLGFLAVV